MDRALECLPQSTRLLRALAGTEGSDVADHSRLESVRSSRAERHASDTRGPEAKYERVLAGEGGARPDSPMCLQGRSYP
jgi:hypothetical protein